MIVIVNYGMGNLNSILNMLKKIGAEAIISADIHDIAQADKLILPGVGAFNSGVNNINKAELLSILNEKVIEHTTPILGICLGMQLFTQKSEEGNLSGLGWLDAETIRFKFDEQGNNLKIPHMGWNTLTKNQESYVLKGLGNDARFYFVHSYHVVCKNKENIIARTHYGYDFVSILQKDNIIGVQFHPEKSHKYGMQLLKNFAEFV